MPRLQCPNCGNTDRRTIETNGSETVMCVRRVTPRGSSYDPALIPTDHIGADGLTACGMQWDTDGYAQACDERSHGEPPYGEDR